MKTWQEISDLIEKKLSYTNGWRISDEEYKELCDEVAKEIVNH